MCSVDYPPQTWSSSVISSHKCHHLPSQEKTCSCVLLYHIWYWWSLISFVFQNIIWTHPLLPLSTITILTYDTFITYLDYCFPTGPLLLPLSTTVYFTQQWRQFMLVISLLKSSTHFQQIFFHTCDPVEFALAALFLLPISASSIHSAPPPWPSQGSSHTPAFFPFRAFMLAVPSAWNDLP